jgi:hypothetical protein
MVVDTKLQIENFGVEHDEDLMMILLLDEV